MDEDEDDVEANAGKGDSPSALGEVVERYRKVKRFEPRKGSNDVGGIFLLVFPSG